MNFIIDTQTQKDLNIFYPADNSVYDLFIDDCKTIGGRNQIYKMLYNPLNNLEIIHARHRALIFLAKADFKPKFENYKIEQIQEYLKLTFVVSKPNIIDINVQKIKNLFFSSHEYIAIHDGITSLTKIIYEFNRLFNDLSKNNFPNLIEEIHEQWNIIQEELNCDSLLRLYYKKRKTRLKVKDVFLLDSKLRTKKNIIDDLLLCVFKMDAYIAISNKLNQTFVLPSFSSDIIQINLQNHYHPLLKEPKANTLFLHKGVSVLTGANMAGKSTLLKSIGICVLLAHAGFPVPAKRMECKLIDGILSSINLSDNLQLGDSFYLNEVKRIKKIIDLANSGKSILVFLDEIFRGTNIEESIMLGKRVIDKLRTYKNCIFIISTHFYSLLKDYEKVNDIKFFKMGVVYENDNFSFSYKVENGISNDFLATRIAENEGLFI